MNFALFLVLGKILVNIYSFNHQMSEKLNSISLNESLQIDPKIQNEYNILKWNNISSFYTKLKAVS